MTFDDELAVRMRRIEAGEWTTNRAPQRSRVSRGSVVVVAAVLGVLTGLGSAFAIGANIPASDGVHSGPGVFNEGQPLHCSGLDQMALNQADTFIRARGFRVFWQVERGDATTMSEVPPAEGSIAGGVVTGPQTIVMVVDPMGTARNAAPAC